MAITKIHPIITTINASINYICDTKKTFDAHGNQENLITCYGTNPHMASVQFEFDLRKTRQGKGQNHLAYHVIQSFSPTDNISFEEAHKIGQEFCESYLKGRYRCVMSTHIDKGHVHNHIIFCAADSIEHKKIHDDKKNMYKIRDISDRICKEHNKEIITEKSGRKGKTYYEWKQAKKGNSWKDKLLDNMKEAIKESHTYEEFLQNMYDRGYDYKGEKIGENEAKYLSFNNRNGQEKWTRVTEKNFGKNFTKEGIYERILKKEELINKFNVSRKQNHNKPKDYSKRNIIDTSADKFTSSPGLQRWGTRENIKIMQEVLNKYGTEAQAQKMKEDLENDTKSCYQKKNDNIDQLNNLFDAVRYMEQYNANKKNAFHYEKSRDQDRYLREHESSILLYSDAVQQLRKLKIDPEKTSIEDLKDMITELEIENDDLDALIKDHNIEINEIRKDLEKLEQYKEVTKASHDIHSIVENNRKKNGTNIDDNNNSSGFDDNNNSSGVDDDDNSPGNKPSNRPSL